MNRTIYRYGLLVSDRTVVTMPAGARVIHAGLGLHDGPAVASVWAEVFPDAPMVDHLFAVIGTGHPLPDGCLPHTYVGSWVADPFVWHAYNLGPVTT